MLATGGTPKTGKVLVDLLNTHPQVVYDKQRAARESQVPSHVCAMVLRNLAHAGKIASVGERQYQSLVAVTILPTRIMALAKQAARGYGGRVVSIEDLEQAAAIAILEARRTYKANYGPFEHYARRTAMLAVRAQFWHDRMPVSIRKNPSAADVAKVKGLVRTDLTEVRHVVGPEQEVTVAQAQRTARVRRRLSELLRDVADAELGLDVLMKVRAPQEIAEAQGIERERVYAARNKARAKLSADPTLYKLWKEEA